MRSARKWSLPEKISTFESGAKVPTNSTSSGTLKREMISFPTGRILHKNHSCDCEYGTLADYVEHVNKLNIVWDVEEGTDFFPYWQDFP